MEINHSVLSVVLVMKALSSNDQKYQRQVSLQLISNKLSTAENLFLKIIFLIFLALKSIRIFGIYELECISSKSATLF